MARKPFDESRLRPGQREAALALVEREFKPKSERKTKEAIAEELEISYMTLWRWENQDDNFIGYKNHIAGQFMDTQLSFVYRKLIEGIDRGSMKGIELYLKRIGDLDDKSEITVNTSGNEKSFEERKAELLARLGKDTKSNDNDDK